jgi:hypothetical protein
MPKPRLRSIVGAKIKKAGLPAREIRPVFNFSADNAVFAASNITRRSGHGTEGLFYPIKQRLFRQAAINAKYILNLSILPPLTHHLSITLRL